MLPSKFWFIWTSGFRGEDFFKSAYEKQDLPVVAMFVNGSGRNEQSLQRTFHRCFLPNFSSFGQRFQRRRFFQKSTNQKQEWSVAAMFVNGSELNEHSLQRTFQGCFLPSFDSFDKAVLEETIFQKSTNQKQELSVAAMFVNRSELNEQSLQRTFQGCFLPSFDSFGQVVQRRRFFQKLTNQKQELPMATMFVYGLGRNEQSLQRTCHRCFLPSFG